LHKGCKITQSCIHSAWKFSSCTATCAH